MDVTNDRIFALSKEVVGTTRRKYECKQCLTPFQLLKEIQAEWRGEVNEDSTVRGLKEVFSNYEDMLLEFCGHQQRVHNQKKYIMKFLGKVRVNFEQALVLNDYKMKF